MNDLTKSISANHDREIREARIDELNRVKSLSNKCPSVNTSQFEIQLFRKIDERIKELRNDNGEKI